MAEGAGVTVVRRTSMGWVSAVVNCKQGGVAQLRGQSKYEVPGCRISRCGSLGKSGSTRRFVRCWRPQEGVLVLEVGGGLTIPDTDPDNMLVIPLTVPGAGWRIEGIEGTVVTFGACGSWDAIPCPTSWGETTQRADKRQLPANPVGQGRKLDPLTHHALCARSAPCRPLSSSCPAFLGCATQATTRKGHVNARMTQGSSDGRIRTQGLPARIVRVAADQIDDEA